MSTAEQTHAPVVAPLMAEPPLVNKWVVALSIAFGSLMATIDSSIVNVAIPHIRGSVGATVEEITWVNTAYIIAMVLIMPLTGLLGALFGQKRLYIASMVLFVIGSVLCGMARSLPTLVIFRILQGFGAGSLQPSQQAILRQTFPPEEQGMAMAIFSMVIMVGPAIGPTLGGWITDNLSWPWIFYINLPVGIVGTFMTWKNVHDSADVRAANIKRAESLKKNMDWSGIILMSVGVSTLQYFLEEGPTNDWFEATSIQVTGFVAAISLAAFIIREMTFPHPVVNLRLFRDPTFASGTAIAAVVYAALMGSMFLLPVFMQELLGFDATLSGMTLMPRTLAMLVVTPIVGRIYNNVPPAIVMALGALAFIFGNYQLSHITLQSGPEDIIVPLVVTGFGMACLMIPLTTVALSTIKREELADAAGLNSFVRQIGGSIGLTVFATLLTNYAVSAKASVAWHISALNYPAMQRFAMLTRRFMAHGLDLNLAHALTIKVLNGKAALEGMVLSFEKSFLLQGLVFVVVLPLLIFLKAPQHSGGKAEHIEVPLE